MMMYEKQEDGNYQGLLFGHLDSPAKTSALPASKKESSEGHEVDCFLKSCGSLMKQKVINPNGLLQRMLEICCILGGTWNVYRSH